MNLIYTLETIEELSDYLKKGDPEKIRNGLIKAFEELLNYRNIEEWNKLVRTCEALAIVGWGGREPVEAIADKWINGKYYTSIQNQYFEEISSKGWKKKLNTYILEDGDDTINDQINELKSQRNPLSKSPIRWSKSGNYQKSVEPFFEALDVLKERVVRELRPRLYGKGFAYIGFNLWFSHHDDPSPTVRSEYFHSEKDIPKNFDGKYYVRPRLKIGKLSSKNGELKLEVERHFTREFGEKDLKEQKSILKKDFLEVIDSLKEKLKKKKIQYDTDQLKLDLGKIMETW